MKIEIVYKPGNWAGRERGSYQSQEARNRSCISTMWREAGRGVEGVSERGSCEALGLQWARKGPRGVFRSRLVTPTLSVPTFSWGTGFTEGSHPPPSMASPGGGAVQGDLLLR